MSNAGERVALSFCSAEDLIDTEIWRPFLGEIEDCLGASLTHLDDRDPVRRKVDEIGDIAEFICALKPPEPYRILHGKFSAKSSRNRVTTTISLFRGENTFPCSASVYFPGSFLESDVGIRTLLSVFEAGNKHLKTFYSYGDVVTQLAGKRKLQGTVNLEVELGGVFWLTYLHHRYITFFGREKIKRFPIVETRGDLSGVTFRFGERPGSEESIAARAEAEAILGADSFVDPTRVYGKPKGKFVLTYDQLRD